MSWRELAPEPARFWIRYSPKRWPAAEAAFVDLVDRRVGWPGPDPDEPLPERPRRGREVLYAPPVATGRRAARERWVLEAERGGSAVLVQIGLAEACEPTATGLRVLDLLAPLLAGTPEPVEEIPPDVTVVFPLLPGVTAGPRQWEPWLRALARGAEGRPVVGVRVELTPGDRRRLAETGGEADWEALFHGDPPSEREFACAVAGRGLSPFPPRPALELFPRRRRNRELATLLDECGDLWLRLGRSESTGLGLMAAARHLESTPLDITGLAREGNLAVLTWLSEAARELIEAWVLREESTLLEQLRAEYLAPEPVEP